MSKSSNVEIHDHGAGHFALIGAVNFDNAGRVMAEGQKLFAQHQDIVVDTSEAEVSNTAGLAVLMEWAAWCDVRDIRLVYEGVQANALAVAELNGVTMMLPLSTGMEARSEIASLSESSC